MRFLLKKSFLLRYDSIHVILRFSNADPENNALIINGTTVHIITANGPEEIDYTLFDS
jgi:glyceraldehyde 3-phosphate dehydrogenase